MLGWVLSEWVTIKQVGTVEIMEVVNDILAVKNGTI